MSKSTNTQAPKSAKKEAWVKPEVSEVDIAKVTNTLPGVGADGGGFADCTLS